MVVWCSLLFKENHTNLYIKIKSSYNRFFCSADIPYFLYELADIEFNFQDTSKSTINDNYKPHKIKFNNNGFNI